MGRQSKRQRLPRLPKAQNRPSRRDPVLIDQFVFKLLFWSVFSPLSFHFQIDQIPESIEKCGGAWEKLQFISDAENRLKSQMPPLPVFQLGEWGKKHLRTLLDTGSLSALKIDLRGFQMVPNYHNPCKLSTGRPDNSLNFVTSKIYWNFTVCLYILC